MKQSVIVYCHLILVDVFGGLNGPNGAEVGREKRQCLQGYPKPAQRSVRLFSKCKAAALATELIARTLCLT